MTRTYLDWNATAPLRPEAKAAMLAAMDALGNPSSVHAEGRAAKATLENARSRIAEALGASGADIIFTSGATEAAALALTGRGLHGADVEHDCVRAWITPDLPVDGQGRVTVAEPGTSTLQLANSETGVIQKLPQGLAVVDAVQAVGKIPFAFAWSGAEMAFVSAHKFGGPKGVGALIVHQGLDIEAQLKGGGQEMSRRAGTENVIGIAGMAAALEAATVELEGDGPARIKKLRNILENTLAAAAPELIFFGQECDRVPGTSCFALPGWAGETQVMQMDLAGIAVSAGSACSSGKIAASTVLRSMGVDEDVARCALRVSLGPTTTEDDIERFTTAWTQQLSRRRSRAA